MTWSRQVDDLEGARAALLDPAGALDLRAAAVLDGPWAELGFEELVPGELVRPLEVELDGVSATRSLGERLAATLRPGDLVVLSGPLGAGKTALAQGIGAGLGVTGAVTSPTFVLARVHRGPVPLVHVDAYRLRGDGSAGGGADLDLDDLELDEWLPDSVTVVEWGEGVVEGLSPSRLEVTLARPPSTPSDGARDANVRFATVRARGPRWRQGQAFTARSS
ncbi:MAG: tRNA ((37)-N6)-threonylcarbamoyltransferase complex ATPase TsaE [Frankiales bacterium]|nr:tRNA ((37)-N6)-threonylcarbamoyltransferase complex ATPase TsaE [Frankiales bacterium]